MHGRRSRWHVAALQRVDRTFVRDAVDVDSDAFFPLEMANILYLHWVLVIVVFFTMRVIVRHTLWMIVTSRYWILVRKHAPLETLPVLAQYVNTGVLRFDVRGKLHGRRLKRASILQ